MDYIGKLLDHAATVDVGGHSVVLKAPDTAAVAEVDAFQNLDEADRDSTWAARLLAKCVLHTVNVEASDGLEERDEEGWMRVIYASERAPGTGLDSLVSAAGRLFGFNLDVVQDGVVDHVAEAEAALGDIPTG